MVTDAREEELDNESETTSPVSGARQAQYPPIQPSQPGSIMPRLNWLTGLFDLNARRSRYEPIYSEG